MLVLCRLSIIAVVFLAATACTDPETGQGFSLSRDSWKSDATVLHGAVIADRTRPPHIAVPGPVAVVDGDSFVLSDLEGGSVFIVGMDGVVTKVLTIGYGSGELPSIDGVIDVPNGFAVVSGESGSWVQLFDATGQPTDRYRTPLLARDFSKGEFVGTRIINTVLTIEAFAIRDMIGEPRRIADLGTIRPLSNPFEVQERVDFAFFSRIVSTRGTVWVGNSYASYLDRYDQDTGDSLGSVRWLVEGNEEAIQSRDAIVSRMQVATGSIAADEHGYLFIGNGTVMRTGEDAPPMAGVIVLRPDGTLHEQLMLVGSSFPADTLD
jgi:hypothetical protein